MKKISQIHIITGLNIGGAETMLYKLLSNMDRDVFNLQVISLTDIGQLGEKIQNLGIPVTALGMKRRGIPDPSSVIKLAKLLKKEKPDIVQTWMYHADLIGGIAANLADVLVIWNIRHSNLDPQGNKRTTIITAKACARLSHSIPKKIICCSEASQVMHKELCYCKEKMIVIPNGFNLEDFKPDEIVRGSVREELGIKNNAFVIGLVARFDPQKDHLNFVKAASVLSQEVTNVHFVLCGNDITEENEQLCEWLNNCNCKDNFHLLGRRDDINRITAAFDIASSSSYGEGFPNVIGEAMACEVPCVVTDVGDSALIVGDTGIVVPPRDYLALAQAWKAIILMNDHEREILGKRARERVKSKFSINDIVYRYENLYKDLLL